MGLEKSMQSTPRVRFDDCDASVTLDLSYPADLVAFAIAIVLYDINSIDP